MDTTFTRIKLSKNFQAGEFFRDTCGGLTTNDITKARRLCADLLQPLRDHAGNAVLITSGKRGREHNARVGGARRSDHLYRDECAAADFTCRGLPAAYRWLAANRRECFGQLIYYPERNFIHASLPSGRHRSETLVCIAGRYSPFKP